MRIIFQFRKRMNVEKDMFHKDTHWMILISGGIEMVRYEPMFFKSTDQQQDGTNEPDQDGFGDKYDIIIKFK